MAEFNTTARRLRNNRWYKSKTFKRMRKIQLRAKPFCEQCWREKPRKMTVANTFDHIDPTWDTWREFIKGPFQSLCRQCHEEKTFMWDIPLNLKNKKTQIKGVNV